MLTSLVLFSMLTSLVLFSCFHFVFFPTFQFDVTKVFMVSWTENQKLSMLCTGYGGNTMVFIFVAKEER